MISLPYKSKEEERLHCLHRYYCWAVVMKRDFEASLQKNPPVSDPSDRIALLNWGYRHMTETFAYQSYWYSALFVVCEGWLDLKFKDATIEGLLAHPNFALLKLYRNAAFHVQKDYFTKKMQNFEAEKSSVAWVRELHAILGEWFLYWLQNHNARDIPNATCPNQSNPQPPA